MSNRVAGDPLNRTILIIEDDPAIGHMLTILLTAEGYKPVLVADGQDALAAAQTVTPALITLDLSLPTLDGAQVLDRLGGVVDGRIPIVIVSAYADQLTPSQRARVSAIVTKPFEIDTLLRCINSALGRT